MKIAISLVVLVHLSGVLSAQEPAKPSPTPPVPSPAVPKLRMPSLPTGSQLTPPQGPTAPGNADASPVPSPHAPPPATSAKPAVPAWRVRLPGAAPPDQSDPGRPRLSLEAISVIDGKPVAVINKRKLAPGDMIAGARVIKILEYRVELEYQGRRFAIGF